MASPGNSGMTQLIQTVNRLHDAFSTSGMPFGLDLPQIVVVGGQSAGKSSVLENFVGKDFLPRGSGIVTRRPLILQLNYYQGQEHAEFLHCPGKFYNFNEVRHEIEAETFRETGSNKGISNRPIHLKVYSPNVLDLTLVDLPGMTRVAVGDQPPDIEVQIRNMVLEYIRKENSIILAVSPANSDLANSDAMKVAKEVDPAGNRTIAVITKLDLMDEGTDARDILTNQLLPLKRGYIGVVNRSQRDIEGNKDIAQAMAAEREYFRSHSKYRDICDEHGTPYLQTTLNKELSRHIHETLPQIRKTLRAKMLEIKKEMALYEDLSDPTAMRSVLMKLLQAFADEVETEIQGLNAEIDTASLAGGAKINRLFYNEFAEALSLEQIPANMLRREIAFAIKNIHGVRNGIFTPDMAFHATIVKIILRFKDPLKQCVDNVGDVLRNIIDKAAECMKDYPKLQEEATFLVKNRIQDQEASAKTQLIQHIDAETSFMNTRHEDFIGKPGEQTNHHDSPEYTQSLNSVKRKLDVTAKVIQKGWLSMKYTSKFKTNEYWFVLTSDSLTSFETDQEEEVIFSLHLTTKIKVRIDKAKAKITLYKIDSKPILLDHKTIDITCEDGEDCTLWCACFKTAGVFPEEPENDEKDKKGNKKDKDVKELKDELTVPETVQRRSNSPLARRNRQTLREFTKSMRDPDMDKQIEVIKLMVESYLKIVGKTIRDLAPKYIMLLLVLNTQKFITSELMSIVLAENTPASLMQGDGEAINKREHLKKQYETTEQALKIIGDAALS